jgi:hypothetical protein
MIVPRRGLVPRCGGFSDAAFEIYRRDRFHNFPLLRKIPTLEIIRALSIICVATSALFFSPRSSTACRSSSGSLIAVTGSRPVAGRPRPRPAAEDRVGSIGVVVADPKDKRDHLSPDPSNVFSLTAASNFTFKWSLVLQPDRFSNGTNYKNDVLIAHFRELFVRRSSTA